MREAPTRKLQALKGTRKVHSIKVIKEGTVMTRFLSCFCDVCSSPEKSQKTCENIHFVGNWLQHDLTYSPKLQGETFVETESESVMETESESVVETECEEGNKQPKVPAVPEKVSYSKERTDFFKEMRN